MYFYKIGELNSRSCLEVPSRSTAILSTENDDKYCFNWSILAKLHPCKKNHPNTVSNYRHFFNEIIFEVFDFTHGFKCSDVHKFEKLNTLSIKKFELNFYQDQNKWRLKLIPIRIS